MSMTAAQFEGFERMRGQLAALEMCITQFAAINLTAIPKEDRELFLANLGIQHEKRLERLQSPAAEHAALECVERIHDAALTAANGLDGK